MSPDVSPQRNRSTGLQQPARFHAIAPVAQPASPEAALEQGLRVSLGRPARIVDVCATSMDTFSSHPISRLRVTLDQGEQLAVIFKRLRPGPGKDVRRELLTYGRLLPGQRFGAPMLYASLCDETRDRYWLFLEDVGRWRLDWCDVEGWLAAARWLADVHATYDGRETELAALDCLGEHGAAFYWMLAETARESLSHRGESHALARFDGLMDRFDSSVAYLCRQPRTLLHGDVSGHNVMIQKDGRIRPIDWEWAAIGVAAWDVDKLLAGWGRKKRELLSAYLDAFRRRTAEPLDEGAFERTLAHCRILRTLWYLRWWIEPCGDPAFVTRLLDKMERTWAGLEAPANHG